MTQAAPTLTIPKISKPVYSFTIPASARAFTSDPESFEVEAWSMAQRLDAERVAAANGTRLDFELFQRACLKIDGKPFDQATEPLNEWSPKVLQLVTDAIDFIGMPEAPEKKAFLASVVKRV